MYDYRHKDFFKLGVNSLAAARTMIFYPLCLSAFSLRKSLNVRVILGPRISKKGCFLIFLEIFEKRDGLF